MIPEVTGPEPRGTAPVVAGSSLDRMLIRRIRDGEELGLRSIFHSSVHDHGRTHYSSEQRSAWAPATFDSEAWVTLMRSLRPWVVETADGLVAYGDLQPNGYIDHLYVAGSQGRKGFGSALMGHLLAEAKASGIDPIHARVSLTAQPLFLKHGFIITAVNTFILRGVEISNATMVRAGGG